MGQQRAQAVQLMVLAHQQGLWCVVEMYVVD